MIEKIVLDYLSEKLNKPVYMETPSNPPTSYVLLEKTGSSRENHIDRATFAIQSYDESLYKTALLNDAVKRAMDDIIELDNISKSSLNSDYNYTDTTNKKYRYQAVYDLIYMED